MEKKRSFLNLPNSSPMMFLSLKRNRGGKEGTKQPNLTSGPDTDHLIKESNKKSNKSKSQNGSLFLSCSKEMFTEVEISF